MGAASLLTDLRNRGIGVRAEGDRLFVEGKLTDSDRANIRAFKPAILALLAEAPDPLLVRCWTPSGTEMTVLADGPDHAEQIRRWNPPPADTGIPVHGPGVEISAPADERRHCSECAHLRPDGLCLAAARGELPQASRTYHPVDDIPRRCERFKEPLKC